MAKKTKQSRSAKTPTHVRARRRLSESRDGKNSSNEIDKFGIANEMLDSATTPKFFIYDNVYVIRQPKQSPRSCHPRTQMGSHLLSFSGKKKGGVPSCLAGWLTGWKSQETPCGCYGLQQWLLNRFKWPAICLNVAT